MIRGPWLTFSGDARETGEAASRARRLRLSVEVRRVTRGEATRRPAAPPAAVGHSRGARPTQTLQAVRLSPLYRPVRSFSDDSLLGRGESEAERERGYEAARVKW